MLLSMGERMGLGLPRTDGHEGGGRSSGGEMGGIRVSLLTCLFGPTTM